MDDAQEIQISPDITFKIIDEHKIFNNDITDHHKFMDYIKNRMYTPEQQLFFAVFENAIWDFKMLTKTKKKNSLYIKRLMIGYLRTKEIM